MNNNILELLQDRPIIVPRILFNNYKKLQSLNLDLPYISKLALELKERGIFAFDELPITLDELYSVMRGDANE